MTSTAAKLSAAQEAALSDLDQTFLQIYQELGRATTELASRATSEILDISRDYLSQNANDVLMQFYALYMGNSKVDARKEQVNQEVDDLFDQIQSQLAQGQEVEIKEDDEAKKERLGLSGLQKQLEGMITLDRGIRDKILPALASMQFEDLVRQRIEHLHQLWQTVAPQIGFEVANVEALGESLATMLTSQAETKEFYELVLNKQPPAVAAEASVFLSFMDEE